MVYFTFLLYPLKQEPVILVSLDDDLPTLQCSSSSPRCQMKDSQRNQTPPSSPPFTPTQPRGASLSGVHPQTQLQESMESSLELSSSLGSVSSLLTRCRTFKVLVIGDSGVGKTCLTHRLCAGHFPGGAEATIGVDFRERALEVDGEKIKVSVVLSFFFFLFLSFRFKKSASFIAQEQVKPHFHAQLQLIRCFF